MNSRKKNFLRNVNSSRKPRRTCWCLHLMNKPLRKRLLKEGRYGLVRGFLRSAVLLPLVYVLFDQNISQRLSVFKLFSGNETVNEQPQRIKLKTKRFVFFWKFLCYFPKPFRHYNVPVPINCSCLWQRKFCTFNLVSVFFF